MKVSENPVSLHIFVFLGVYRYTCPFILVSEARPYTAGHLSKKQHSPYKTMHNQ